jgi:acetoin utilization protein AcuB
MNNETTIRKIYTSKVVSVLPGDKLMKIEGIFDLLSFHHILVVENEQLKGIISKNDLLKWYSDNASRGVIPDRNQIIAADIMTTDPITLDVDDSIGLAADIILSNKLHAIPVLDGQMLMGIITSHDIIKYCFT